MQATPTRALDITPLRSTRVQPLPWSNFVAGVVAALAVLMLIGTAYRTLPQESALDFGAYYYAASAVLHGQPLYDRAMAFRDAGLSIHAPNAEYVDKPEAMMYAYAPAFAVVMSPFALLPMRAASDVWYFLSVACLAAAAYALGRVVFPSRWPWAATVTLGLTAAFLLFRPVRLALRLGQVEPILLLLVMLSFSAFAARRDGWAGVWLGLAVVVKPPLALLALFYLWKRAYRTFGAFVTTAATLALLPFIFLGLGPLADYLAVAAYWSGPTYGASPVNQSPYGLLLRLFSTNPFTTPVVDLPLLVFGVRCAVIAATLGILAKCVTRRRTGPVIQQALEYGLVLIAMLLVGPFSEDIHYAYLVIPIATMIALIVRMPLDRLTISVSLVLAATCAYLSLPDSQAIMYAGFEYLKTGPVPAPMSLVTGSYVYALLLVGALVLTVRARVKQTDTANP